MKSLGLLLFGLFLSSSVALPSKAQITIDGTTSTTLTPTDNGIRIDEGDRAGANLFHSFEKFSVPNGTEAFFNNANNIVNIFSRVTGGNISNIDGLLRANGTANLFLINPAGIIFGEGARLDIDGSFFATTAESIVFSDGVEFLATDADNLPLLMVNMPLGLNLGNNPGNIINRSVANDGNGLEVATGKSMTLVGGNINLEGGRIFAPGGRVDLGGLSTAGEVEITADGSLVFPKGVARADVTLTNAAEVNVQASGYGSINVDARNLKLSGGELGASNLVAGITLESRSSTAQAGDITINATNNITVSQGSGIYNTLEYSGVGNTGDITINTGSLEVNDGALIDASTSGRGDAGAIRITAKETVSFHNDSYAFSRVYQDAQGNSGGVIVTTGSLNLTNGGQINADTFGRGNGADITVNARDSVNISGVGNYASGLYSNNASENALGVAGDITIDTGSLEVTDGGIIDASTRGLGDSGLITITAKDTVSFHNDSYVFSRVNGGAEGDSGGVVVNTGSLNLTNGGQINADTFGRGNGGDIIVNARDLVYISGSGSYDSGLYSDNDDDWKSAVGDAGDINIKTGSLEVSDGAVIDASTEYLGNAGAINITAEDTVSFHNDSYAFSRVNGGAEGDSGGVVVNTGSLNLTNGGQINADTFGRGNGADITVNARDLVYISGSGSYDSGLYANALQGNGNGGNITITTDKLIVRDDAVITVGNFSDQAVVGSPELFLPGTGNAGDITINARSVEVSDKGEITGDNANGVGGNLTLNADFLTLKNEASISAETTAEEGKGGILELEIEDILLMSQSSSLSARADIGANGGNIDINANFVIAFPNQNNKIIASANQGNGGNINITTRGIFGIEERPLNPFTNDINASSQFGLDGTIAINQIDVDPTERLDELPTEVIDITGLIEGNLCQQAKGSEFIITGKGGIAPAPSEVRDGNVSEVDLVEPVIVSENVEVEDKKDWQNASPDVKKEIVEAQGWIMNDRGIVELVAYKTDVNGFPSQPKDTNNCHK